MALSRKHYESIAQILRENAEFNVRLGFSNGTVAQIAEDLANYFAEENPSFDRDRFLRAVATA